MVHNSIHEAAAKVIAAQSKDAARELSVEDPWINGISRRINIFDVFDGMQRMLVLVEPLPKDENGVERNGLHIIKWHCNDIQAHSLAIEAVYQTRLQEQESILKAISTSDVIPADYTIVPNGSHETEG